MSRNDGRGSGREREGAEKEKNQEKQKGAGGEEGEWKRRVEMRTGFWSEREKPAHKNHQVDQAQETRAVEDLAEEGGKYRKTRIEKKHKELFFSF